MSAMLAADYTDRTIEVLERLREVLERRHAQSMLIADDETSDFGTRMHALGSARGFGVAIDDITVAIQREQGR